MNNYFTNPELKRSLFSILGLAFITLIISFFIMDTSYDKIKINYAKSNMAILGEISKNHPELSEKIIPIITKGPNEQNIQDGKKLLKEYGFSENIEIDFIPQVDNSYKWALKYILIMFTIFFSIVLMIISMEYIRIYRNVESLILAAKNIVDCKFDIGIYENAEGLFAKLGHSFNNMRVIMKNNFLEVQKEKKFLTDILSDISHQLKTPISSLIIYNDILLNRKIDEYRRKDFLENSRKQLNRIQWLIKSLLQLAKLDAGVIKFEKLDCNINNTVEEAVLTLIAKAENEKINLTFCPKEKQIMIKHDTNWLSEGVINLIKNALEHTKEGGNVEVSTERTAVCVRIIIKDNGEGIPKEEMPHIFKRFYKGKTRKKTESVGIGLALSKSIVEGHDGMIEVESKINEGTTFTITFLAVS
ncbi:HAMP domain-containing sensor histidine kinase [Clostridium sp. MB40-C1]|uniref:sensor histidine kinase n=1 Tax=Clostridium sp. MB40-C1 TaxID=3070996 RepID=UPI0027E207BB|nr:HAMP domain-containing sensor histidine kinase [Clostridium sp. MB40-C1]WMJ82053.1 HAMP domain-containing sensor histidine kinase [Clostridium sp. MB40-C1]